MAERVTNDGRVRKDPSFLYGLAALALTIGLVAAPMLITDAFEAANPINTFQAEQQRACRAKPEGCRAIGSWSASMIPDVFAEGESRDAVVRRLAEAGYGTDDEASFVRRAGSTFPACDHYFYVLVTFNEAGRLTSAKGQGGSVCL